MDSREAVFPDVSLVGFVQTLGMLRDEAVQEFVKVVREREDLEHPEDRNTLQRNLRKHGLDDFAAEAEGVAAQYWLRALQEEEEDFEAPEEWRILSEACGIESPARVTAGMLRLFGRGVGHAAKQTARVISRYIVAGFMEVPGPIGLPASVVTPFPMGQGAQAILAFITPLSDLKATLRRIRELHGRMFAGERNRLPDRARETLWLRFCAFVAGRDEEVEAGKYRYLAELHFELHPKDKPPGQPLDPVYEKGVERHGWRIRKNSRYWEKYRLRYEVAQG